MLVFCVATTGPQALSNIIYHGRMGFPLPQFFFGESWVTRKLKANREQYGHYLSGF
jgi:hypothetical protein